MSKLLTAFLVVLLLSAFASPAAIAFPNSLSVSSGTLRTGEPVEYTENEEISAAGSQSFRFPREVNYIKREGAPDGPYEVSLYDFEQRDYRFLCYAPTISWCAAWDETVLAVNTTRQVLLFDIDSRTLLGELAPNDGLNPDRRAILAVGFDKDDGLILVASYDRQAAHEETRCVLSAFDKNGMQTGTRQDVFTFAPLPKTPVSYDTVLSCGLRLAYLSIRTPERVVQDGPVLLPSLQEPDNPLQPYERYLSDLGPELCQTAFYRGIESPADNTYGFVSYYLRENPGAPFCQRDGVRCYAPETVTEFLSQRFELEQRDFETCSVLSYEETDGALFEGPEARSPEWKIPEPARIIAVEERDGLLVIWSETFRGEQLLSRNELTVRPLPDGSWRYLSNRVEWKIPRNV